MPPVVVVGVVDPLPRSEPKAGAGPPVLDNTAALRCCMFEVSAGTGANVVGGAGAGAAVLLDFDPKHIFSSYAART